MIGMVEGNGHPYSWSAIINGRYNEKEMQNCGYPVIPEYLGKNKDKLGIEDAEVTHIWTDNPEDAVKVAKASYIPNVVKNPEDVIGKVDAVCIATDIGSEHIERIKPFLGKGLTIFVDKPLTDNRRDLLEFIKLYRSGERIISSSCMRYAEEIADLKRRDVGKLGLVTAFTCKSWERYGIHALEGLYQLVGPGFVSVRNVGEKERDMVILKHRSGADAVIWAYYEVYGGFGTYQKIGDKGADWCKFENTFAAFKAQLVEFVNFVRTGRYPFPPEETFELIAIIVGGIESREGGGKEIELTEIIPQGCFPRI